MVWKLKKYILLIQKQLQMLFQMKYGKIFSSQQIYVKKIMKFSGYETVDSVLKLESKDYIEKMVFFLTQCKALNGELKIGELNGRIMISESLSHIHFGDDHVYNTLLFTYCTVRSKY